VQATAVTKLTLAAVAAAAARRPVATRNMARLFVACMVLLGLAMAAAAARPATTTTTAEDPPTGDCNQDLNDLITNCQDYVRFPDDPKIPPSAACCGVIQGANIPCLCSKVTPTVETLISMDKVVYVASYCGRPLKPGSQCGSK